MTEYAKIKEDGTLEYAPRNIPGVSNWINDEAAVLAAGYLPFVEVVIPEGKYISGYVVEDGEIVPILEKIPEPTKEEIAILREQAYIQEVDKITCHINRLKDEEQTPEVIAEIASLVEERKAKVESIKQRFPYPDESIEKIDELPLVEEVTVSKMENVEESNSSEEVI